MNRLFSIVASMLSLFMGVSNAQSWKESSGTEWNYNLSGIKILTVIYEGFNYDEAVDISDYWKKWGAQVDIAGTSFEQHGERNNPVTGKAHDEIPATLKPDLLLADADHRMYDLVYFPGGEGVQEFLNSGRDAIRNLIDRSVSDKKYVAAICHSPVLLSASGLLRGHEITVQGNEFKPELMKSGARIVNKIFVCDGYFITGQWPYFETFAASVAEKLQYPEGNGPFAGRKKENGAINRFLEQRNVYIMKPGEISDDTIRLIVRSSVNPVLPFEMMNNSYLRVIAVKDSSVKSLLANQLVQAGTEKFKSQNITADALKRYWTMMLNAPVVLLIYNDLAEMQSSEDREIISKIAASLAGQSVAQMISVAGELGYGASVMGGMRSLIAEEGFRKILDIPVNYVLMNIVTIGQALEKANPPVIRPVGEYLIIK